MNLNKDEIKNVPLNILKKFPNHPFSVKDDDEMQEMVSSIKEYGILNPIIARVNDEGNYEIISGHRRVHACELCGIAEIPVVIKNCSHNEAVIMMVDSNLHRGHINPIEKGKAYKMKLEAIKNQGKRNDLTCDQVGHKLDSSKKSVDFIAEESNESKTQIQRYIRLTELIPDLQKIVEKEMMGITTASELSFLNPDEQKWVFQTIQSDEIIPSLSQAQKLKKKSKEGTLTEDKTFDVLTELKKPERQNIVLTPAKIGMFVPRTFSLEQTEQLIIKLLEGWAKYMQKKTDKNSIESIESGAHQQKKTKRDRSL